MICKAASCEYSGEIEIQLFKTTKKQTRNPTYKENSNLTFVFNPKSEAAQLKMGRVQDSIQTHSEAAKTGVYLNLG